MRYCGQNKWMITKTRLTSDLLLECLLFEDSPVLSHWRLQNSLHVAYKFQSVLAVVSYYTAADFTQTWEQYHFQQ